MLAWHKSQLKELPMAKAGTVWESKWIQNFFYFKSYNNDQRKICINSYIEKNSSKTNNLIFKFKEIREEEKNKISKVSKWKEISLVL